MEDNTQNSLDSFSLDDGDVFSSFMPESTDKEKNVVEEIKKDSLEPEKEKETKKKEKQAQKEEQEVFKGFTDDDFDDEDADEDESEKVKDTKKVEKKAAKDEDEDEDEDQDEEEGTDPDKAKKEDKDKDEDEDDFADYAADLKDRGIFANVELKEGEKITGDQLFNMHEAEFEKRIEETFEGIFEEIGKDGGNFLQFVKDGGNAKLFINHVTTKFTLDKLDLDNEAQVARTIKHFLSKYDDTIEEADIEDRMTWMKEAGKEKAYAEKYFEAIKKAEDKTDKDLLNGQKAVLIAKEDKVKELNKAISEKIYESDKVGPFSLNKKEQKELEDDITKATVKVGKNKFVPPFYAELGKTLEGKTDKDKKRLILLAKLFKEDFNFESVKNDLTTQVTKSTKARIARNKTNVRNTSSGGEKRSLADIMT